jgi:hypothetical protein
MPSDASRSASEAINEFIGHLAEQGFAASTRRIRRHFLVEYLRHAEMAAADAGPGAVGAAGAAGAGGFSVEELMEPSRADAWLSDAAAGKTRTRIPMRGRDAAAYPNSMRVRIDSYNAFADFLGRAERLDTKPPAQGYRLTAADTKLLLQELSTRRPVQANGGTALRTAALAALVADTERTVPELARLTVRALHLDGEAAVDLADGSCPLSEPTVQILSRWLVVRASIISELQGSDPGHLWIPVKPGRPRGGRAPVKPGITPAAVRTLHSAHRSLVSRVLGTPLRPGAFREAGPSRS